MLSSSVHCFSEVLELHCFTCKVFFFFSNFLFLCLCVQWPKELLGQCPCTCTYFCCALLCCTVCASGTVLTATSFVIEMCVLCNVPVTLHEMIWNCIDICKNLFSWRRAAWLINDWHLSTKDQEPSILKGFLFPVFRWANLFIFFMMMAFVC